MGIGRSVMLLLTSVVVVATGCASGKKQPVRDRVQSYYTDLSDRDWDAFRDNFWDGATLTTVWQPPDASADRVVITTLDEFIEQAPNGPGSKPIFAERMTGSFVMIEKDLAHVWASYEAEFGDENEISEWTGIDAITLLRHDGHWRIVSIVYSPD